MPYEIDIGENIELYAGIPFAGLIIPLAGFVFLISLIAAVKLFQKIAELQIEEREKLVLQKQTVYLQEQIRDIDGIYGEIKGMRHDMKNHLYNIRILVKSVLNGNTEDNKELEKYLGSFEDTLNKFEFFYQTGNSISDIILHQKYLESVNNGIDFSADFIYPAHLNFDAYDIAVILDNGLENAIEACSSIEGVEPYIKLSAYIKGEMFIIEIENNFIGQITVDEHTQMPISSKVDKDKHGMGISNIQRCARKYYGDIDLKISTNKDYKIFNLTVMLQGRD
jgi:sensor histidine kinase YesM